MDHRKEKKNIFWIMGPTSSGKTTLAKLLHKRLIHRNKFALHYDGDEVRDIFGDNLGFSKEERLMVVKTLAYVSKKALLSGANVVVSALTAFDDARLHINKNLYQAIIIYLRCSISECANRDPKGLYAKEKKGEINTLVGASSVYNEPDSPHIILDTELCTPEDSLQELIFKLGKIQIHI